MAAKKKKNEFLRVEDHKVTHRVNIVGRRAVRPGVDEVIELAEVPTEHRETADISYYGYSGGSRRITVTWDE